ncbi:MAG: hypothetical protein SFY80_04140 [Verrucomicrobiota bacterium]|nr:hypothetical protein [Verrucomicrobiota bacterium]
MIRIIAILLGLLLTQGLFAEETDISPGMTLSEAETGLKAKGFPFGSEYTVKWVPPKGMEYVYCRLDKQFTMVLVVDSSEKEVLGILIHCPSRSKTDPMLLHPIAVGLASSSYWLVFKKDVSQTGEPIPDTIPVEILPVNLFDEKGELKTRRR